MKIGLVDLKDPRDLVIDKTIAGGMGTATRYGKEGFGNLLTRVKARLIRLLPYNVAYIAAILRAQGHEVLYRPREDPIDYDLAVVFSVIPSREVDAHFVRRLRQEGVPSIVVGTIAGIAPEIYSDAALILKGEPEGFFLVPEWTDELKGWQKGQARLLEVDPIKNLDILPFPDWSVFPSRMSRYAVVSVHQPVLPVVSSRGCPYPCGYYCPYPLGEGKVMRYRNPGSVAEEIRHLKRRYGVTALKFRDPILTINRKRTEALLEALESVGHRFIWGCETHLFQLDEPLLVRMAKAGCRMIQTGIETTNPDALEASQRKTADAKHQRRMLELCRDLGIKAAIYFIVGLPGDTLESMKKNLDYATELPAAFIQITACTPYPGTRFFEDVKDRLLTRDWRAFDQYTPVLKYDGFGSDELLELMSYGYRRFYLRRRWVKDFLAVQRAGWQLGRPAKLRVMSH